MNHDDNPGPVDPAAGAIIYRRLRHLAGRAGLTTQDLEDLEQLLWVKLLECPSLPDGNPTRREQVIATIVAHCVSNFLRDRRADKRDYRRLRSLHMLVDTGEGQRIELAQTVAEDAHDARLGRQRRDAQEQTELALDVAAVLAALPDRLRTVAEHLLDAPVAEVARRLGMRPSTLYGLIHHLRRRFRRAGLGDYL